MLVSPDDVAALAAGIERVLTDRALAERMGQTARERAERWLATPAEYADNMLAVVHAALATGPQREGK